MNKSKFLLFFQLEFLFIPEELHQALKKETFVWELNKKL